MSAKKVNRASKLLLLSCIIVVLLLLSLLNIEAFLAPVKVLGAETETDKDREFWEDFVTKNPDYIPGWIELGRYDKVYEIDPNFLTP